MKTKIISAACLLLLGYLFLTGSLASAGKNNSPPEGTMNVYTTSEVYDLTKKWVDEYRSANPLQDIQVSNMIDPEIVAQFQSGDNICFTSSGKFPEGTQGSGFRVVVGREIIVPVISPKNPFLGEIGQKGISLEALTLSIQSSGKMTWGSLLNNDLSTPVKYYFLNDQMVQSGVEGFLGTGSIEKGGMISLDSEELIRTLQEDPYAIVFCRLTDIVQPSAVRFPESLRLMPIDKNGSGKMEYMEQIYGDVEEFSRGVWIGKYPKELIHQLYCIADARPQNEANLAFLRWVLTSGQEYLPLMGYSAMAGNEQQAQLNRLFPILIAAPLMAESNPTGSILIFILLGLAVLVAIGSFIFRTYRKRQTAALTTNPGSTARFDENSVVAPGGLYFDKTHTWAFMEQNGTVKIGIDDFLQHVIGTVTRIEMKKPGERIKKGDVLCTLIQKGKQLDIYAPVSGRINRQNELLLTDLSAINHHTYTDGWIYCVEPDNWVREITFLFMAEKYHDWIREEFSRLKDFLTTCVLRNASFSSTVILQEGGQLRDHVLTELEPKVWEDFQIRFINAAR